MSANTDIHSSYNGLWTDKNSATMFERVNMILSEVQLSIEQLDNPRVPSIKERTPLISDVDSINGEDYLKYSQRAEKVTQLALA